MKVRLSSLVALGAILGLVVMVGGLIVVHRGGWLNLLYPLSTLLVGMLLYLRYPILYIEFTWWVWFLTPEVRRFVDYQSNWNPQSTVMLAPYLVTGLTLFTLLRHSPKLHIFPFLAVGFGTVGLLYGYLIGIFRVGAAGATYDLITWFIPIFFAFHLMVHWRQYLDYRRVTQRTFAWGVLVMGLYGLQQFFQPPEWDQFWMRNVPMASIGNPEPFEVRLFSTLNSPGPYAIAMIVGIVVLLSIPRLRHWPILGLGYVNLLLSLVRSAWGTLIPGLYFLAAHRGRSRPRLIATLAITGLIIWPLLSFGPIADVIDTRLQTINDLQQDDSFEARLQLYAQFAPQAFSNPVGEGLGSTGVSTKLSNEGGALGEYANLDSGIMAIPFVLGWPGGLLYAGGLIWLSVYALRTPKVSDLFAAACRGVTAALLMNLIFTNVMTSVSGMLLWYFLSLAVAARMYHRQTPRVLRQQDNTRQLV